MDKSFNPQDSEAACYAAWDASGAFSPGNQSIPYCIMLPPPNVTGTLHMGHAFQDSVMDALIRYNRMQNHATLWQAGTDHAGIATQMVVERNLQREGLGETRHSLGRTAFVDKIWEWKAKSSGTIQHQLKRMGTSLDWSRERFTMDKGMSDAVLEAFVRLYDEGLIYRGKRLVNWDPSLQTAVSDLEVHNEPEAIHLYHLRYSCKDNPEKSIVVATTRPETLFGDVAVAVHPDDARYQDMIGQMLVLPISGRTIPVIADPFVDQSFGSGAVKITPAHDFNDFEVGKRHGLPLINLLNPDATMNHDDAVPAPYRGLNRFVARKQLIAALTASGELVKTDPHTSPVPRGDRSGDVLEPYLTDQWFVKTDSLAKAANDVVERDEIQFVPGNYKAIYQQWLHNIQDWCISRQLWWGHQIPAYYDEHGNTYVGRSEEEVRNKHKLDANIVLKQDEDVLDTWFSSALWPCSTLGWPNMASDDLKRFYPTDTLVTGHDILFFWVARMVMFGVKFTGKIPFRTVYVHGLVLDAEGQKMSKSKGNVLDPLDLCDGITLEALLNKRTDGLMQPKMAEKIAKATETQFPNGIAAYGTDALRITLLSLATQGRFVRFDLNRLEGYRHFGNKLWNASKLVLDLIASNDYKDSPIASSIDRAILHRLQETIAASHRYFAEYRFDLLVQTLYEFMWDVYCDWYLEYAKLLLKSGDTSTTGGTKRTLYIVHTSLLKLLHPLIPFLTETLWGHFKPHHCSEKLLIVEQYPSVDASFNDEAALASWNTLQELVEAVRRLRGDMRLSPAKDVSLVIRFQAPMDEAARKTIAQFEPIWKSLAKVHSLQYLDDNAATDALTTHLAWGMVGIPYAGNVDVESELKRLQTERVKIDAEVQKIEQKLGNEAFTSRAKPEVVALERSRLVEFQTRLDAIAAQEKQLSDKK